MLGGAMAMSSWIVGALHIGWIWSSLIGLLGAIACTISDWKLAGFELPIHRRQVNEDWLDRYRQWVYGAGFGWQIGCGFATYITSASLYLMVLLAVLAGDPLLSAAIGTSFGLVRGLAILAGRRIDSPERLKAFHKHFERAGAIFRASAIGVQMVVVGAISFSISVRLGAVVSSALAALILARTSRHPLLGQLTPREVQVAISAESTVPAGFVPVRRETANAVHESD